MSATKMIQINIRVPSQVISELDTLAGREHASRIHLTRQILLEGLAERKRALALRLYREGKVTKSRAAEIAGISMWEIMDLIDQAELPSPYTLEEAVEDVRRLMRQFQAAPRTITERSGKHRRKDSSSIRHSKSSRT